MLQMNYYLDCFQNKYTDFDGRARRSEYWYFILFHIIVAMIAGSIDVGIIMATGGAVETPIFIFIYVLASFIPGLAVAVRRLHDTNRSGWWMLLSFIPVISVIGGIIILIFALQEGDYKENQYGPNPKRPQDDDITKHLVE